MGTRTITGDATFTLFGRVFNDFADGDVSTIIFPNDFITMKTGKNGNTIYSRNAPGKNSDCVLRLVRGSSDDKFLQDKLALSDQDFALTELGNGQFVERLGDGGGNVILDVYQLSGGIISRGVDGKENVEGDTVQGVAIWNIKFPEVVRSSQ